MSPDLGLSVLGTKKAWGKLGQLVAPPSSFPVSLLSLLFKQDREHPKLLCPHYRQTPHMVMELESLAEQNNIKKKIGLLLG